MSFTGKYDNDMKVTMPPDMINEIMKLERSCCMNDHLKIYNFKKVLRNIEDGDAIILIDPDWEDQQEALQLQIKHRCCSHLPKTNYHFEKFAWKTGWGYNEQCMEGACQYQYYGHVCLSKKLIEQKKKSNYRSLCDIKINPYAKVGSPYYNPMTPQESNLHHGKYFVCK